MIQLGISAFYHDSAAALVIDGEVVAAIEEEKLSGIKHDNSFPLQAIQFCLDYAGLDISYVDVVCWYEEPELKYDRVSKTLGKRWIAKSKTWNEFKETFSKTEGNLKSYLENSIGYTGEIYYVKHHHSHLAFSYYTSPFKEALGVSIDGVGEWDTAVFAKCDENGFTEIDNIKFPHSLGLVYSTITSYLGFKPNSGEYKVMGLAPYGDPKVYEYVFDKIERNSKHLFQVVKKYFTRRDLLAPYNPSIPNDVSISKYHYFSFERTTKFFFSCSAFLTPERLLRIARGFGFLLAIV